jgi:hypothetical protein
MAPLLFGSPVFWLTVALCAVTTVMYRMAWLAASRHFRPSDTDILSEEEALAHRKAAAARRSRTRSACLHGLRQRLGLARPARSADARHASAAEDELPVSSLATDGV